jgi:hypothetical protein
MFSLGTDVGNPCSTRVPLQHHAVHRRLNLSREIPARDGFSDYVDGE